MLSIDYFGRTGNQIFQWVFARLLAEKNGLGIINEPPKFYHPVLPALPGKINGDVGTLVLDDTVRNRHDHNYLCNDYSSSNIRLHGYFQNSDYYNSHREHIKKYFDLPPMKKNYDDIVIHLRLTDYWWNRVRSVIHPGWYTNILKKERYTKCYIVVEPHETNKKYLSILKQNIRNAVVVSGSPRDDFEFIRGFSRILCSNSTFCWWAAFLSNAERIYTFKPWMNNDRMNLAYIPMSVPTDGQFFGDAKLSQIDWSNYWDK